jgi:hypothetical protein
MQEAFNRRGRREFTKDAEKDFTLRAGACIHRFKRNRLGFVPVAVTKHCLNWHFATELSPP